MAADTPKLLINSDSHDSETHSFSYPGIPKKHSYQSAITRCGTSNRMPVRILPVVRDLKLKMSLAKNDGTSQDETSQTAVSILSSSNADTSSSTLEENNSEMELKSETNYFSKEADTSIGSIQCENTGVDTFQEMGWLLESARKNRTNNYVNTRERHQTEKMPSENKPSIMNQQFANFSTPRSKQECQLGVFKEIGNFSDLKSRPAIQLNTTTPFKTDSLVQAGLHSENIIATSSNYKHISNNPIKSEFFSIGSSSSTVYKKQIIKPVTHVLESDTNLKPQINMPLHTKHVLQEIPLGDISSKMCTPVSKAQPSAAHGCPVTFSQSVNNQNKENEALAEGYQAQANEPLNLNIKDLTGNSEHQADLKMNSKYDSVQTRQPSHHAQPHPPTQKMPEDSIHPPPPREIKLPTKTPPAPADSSDSNKVVMPGPLPTQLPKTNASPDNVMFSLPAAKARSSSLSVNGKNYAIISQLGTGGSSKVYQVMDGSNSITYAVKCVDLAGVDPAIARGYINEIELLKKLQHCDSVIRLFGYEYVKTTKSLLVVMEKGDTDFSNFLRDINKSKKISTLLIAYYWTEMVTAVANIHANGIIHSDLKPANFLLVAGRLKLIDFGIASSINVDMTSVVKDQMMGTFNYMSPEAIGALNSGGANPMTRKITFKSDIWSLGCILYNLVYGRTPFAHIAGIGKLMEIFNPQHVIRYPEVDYPPALVFAVKSCLTYDPKMRPSAAELLQSPLLPTLQDPDLMVRVKSIVTPQMWAAINGKID